MRKIIASLDIGSNTIKLIVGEIFKKRLNILAVSEIPSQGIKKGIVINPDLTYEALKELFLNNHKSLDLPIREVIVNVPSYDLETMIVSASNTITSENNIITSSDIVRVLQSAVYNRVSDNREIVGISPIVFNVDGEKSAKPIGSVGTKLDVKAIVSSIPKKNVYGILNALDKMNVEVLDFTINGAADYYTFEKEEYKDSCGAIINIGGDTTTVSILNKGIVTASSVIELGGSNIDSDISFVYKINKNDSLMIKEKIGLATPTFAQSTDYMEVKNNNDEIITINQYGLSEVIVSRVKEILKLAKKQINLLTKKDISYIIVTGGVTELKDFKDLLVELFGENVTLGTILEMGVRNNKYSVGVGLIKYYDYTLRLTNKDYSLFTDEELKELNKLHKGSTNNKIIDKLFGYFFDN